MTTSASEYFVRINRQVRGPFSRDVLTSMFARGRVTHDTPISSDRNQWVELRTLGEPFASGASMLDDLTVRVPTLPPSISAQYFCTIDGETQGPFSLEHLQQLVTARRLESNDQVWQQGQPNWMAAGDVPSLGFVSQRVLARSWIQRHLVLSICLILMSLTVIALPTYYVLASAAARKAERVAAELAQQQLERQERAESEIKDKIDREERRFKILIDQQRMQHEEEMARLGANDRDTQATERRHQEELAQRQRQHTEQMELLRQQVEALKSR